MNRRLCATLLASTLAFLGLAFLTGCGNDDANSPTPSSVAVQGGSGQSVQIGANFSTFTAKVTNRAGHPLTGVTVTFSAPAAPLVPGSGATCSFPTGVSDTETTNANGMATSAVCTANLIAGSYIVTASVAGVTGTATFHLTNTVGAASTIATTAGDGQSASTGAAFATALSATVLDSGSNPVSGVSVTFTAPSSGASGTFANTTNIDTETTDASGVATSTTFTANATTGSYIVAATANGVAGEADFNLTNTSSGGGSSIAYTFYVSGLPANGAPFYALAGTFTIDSNGNFVGEQDYNDGVSITSSAHIIGGSSYPDSPTQGIVNLITDNPNLGVNGTETFAIDFTSPYHAIITQFDGTNTSSGSMDYQTPGAAPSGNYAFTLTGVDSAGDEIGAGGVLATNAGDLSNSLVDINDYGSLSIGNVFGGTISAPDAYGRGTITTSIPGTSFATTVVYYMVHSGAMRLIDMDDVDVAGGSAFSQGPNTFDNTSLGSSVFAIQANPWGTVLNAAVGMFSTDQDGIFEGLGDNDEDGSVSMASTIDGYYWISTGPYAKSGKTHNDSNVNIYNGYGSLSFVNGLQDVQNWGIYMVDPTLNINDPNNPSGAGGALVLDLDDTLAGTVGVITPQTDTAPSSFGGNYTFGGQEFNQNFNTGWEFDFVGEGVVDSNLNLTGYGLLNDTFAYFSEGPNLYTNVGYNGTAVPDNTVPGRYTMNFNIVTPDSSLSDASVVIYQASGIQLFWMEEDNNSLFLGPVEWQNYYYAASQNPLFNPKSKLKK